MSAFDGIRILDFSQGLVGPMAAMLMGDFAAEVIKVEGPAGDRFKDKAGYVAFNRNKLRLSLDIESPDDLPKVRDLLAGADIAIFDHNPGQLEPLGLDGESLTKAFPGLIHLWVPPFGVTGRWSDLPSHHATLTALMGAAFRQGSYSGSPVWHVAPIVHYSQAIMAAGAASAALLERSKSGLGQAVTVSGLHGMSEVSGTIGFAGSLGASYGGNPLGGSASYRLYQCGDGEWLFLGALFSNFFDRAIDAMGMREMRTMPPGVYDMADLMLHLFRQKPRDEWVRILTDHGSPAAAVGARDKYLESEPVLANDLVCHIEDAELGRVTMPGVAVRMEKTPGRVRHLIRDAKPEEVTAFAARRPARSVAGGERLAPLEGVRVLDLGTVIAGAYTSAILANFGADVAKIEGLDGDPFRPYGTGFVNYNRGKRGLGLDLKRPEGRELFFDLVRQADVVVDNYRLGVRERLGIGYEHLKAVNPRIISCSINTYGARGSEAHQPGFDPLLQARSGLMAAQGGSTNEPVFHSIPVNDVATAAMASFGVIAALHARHLTGEGQAIETSLAAQGAIFQMADLTTWPGAPEAPMGCRDCTGFMALDRYYRCRDGWLVIAATRPVHFDAIVSLLGDASWHDRFGDPLGEPRDGDLADALEGAMASLRRDATVDALLEAGVPAAPVLRGDEALSQDWLWDNRYFALHSDSEYGDLVANRGYADFSASPSGYASLHPGLGEHSGELLMEYGIERERIIKLAEQRVIFRRAY